jgi:hypothetical protein
MVCHTCGKPASGRCESCRRYMCSQHTSGMSTVECQECTSRKQEKWNQQREREQATLRRRGCVFCRRPEASHLANHQCGVCLRWFCLGDGQFIVKTPDSIYSSSTYGWMRCKDHLVIEGVLGYHGTDALTWRQRWSLPSKSTADYETHNHGITYLKGQEEPRSEDYQ